MVSGYLFSIIWILMDLVRDYKKLGVGMAIVGSFVGGVYGAMISAVGIILSETCK